MLAANGQTFPKTHDLVPLLARCESIDQGLSRFLNAARVLTPYAVRFRYPGGPFEPDVAEAQQAIRLASLASEVVKFVRQRLPVSGTP